MPSPQSTLAAIAFALTAIPAQAGELTGSLRFITPETPTITTTELCLNEIICRNDPSVDGSMDWVNIDLAKRTVTANSKSKIFNMHFKGCLIVVPGAHPDIRNSVFDCETPIS